MKIQHLLNEVQNIDGVESDTISYGDLSDIQKIILSKLSSGAISYNTGSANTKKIIDELENLGLVYLGDVTQSGEKMVDIYNDLNNDESEESDNGESEEPVDPSASSFRKVKDELSSLKDDGDTTGLQDQLRF